MLLLLSVISNLESRPAPDVTIHSAWLANLFANNFTLPVASPTTNSPFAAKPFTLNTIDPLQRKAIPISF